MNLLRRIETQAAVTRALLETTANKQAELLAWNFAVLKTKIAHWVEGGEKTFVLTKALVEAFTYTDIPFDLKPEEFRYPFETFIIECESPMFETRIGSEKPMPVSHILYTDARMAERNSDGRFVTQDGQESDHLEWDHGLTAMFTMAGFIEHMDANLRNGHTLKEALDTKRPGTGMLPLDADDKRNLVNIFYNAVMYINDPKREPAETEEPRVRQFREKKGGPFREQKYILLKAPRSYRSISEPTGRHIDKRFVVRGHWRNQPFGKDRAERRHIWIQPFWKGPELAEVIKRPYKVE